MRNFLNLKDIPARDLKKILFDAKRRKRLRKRLNNLEIDKTIKYCNEGIDNIKKTKW